MYTCFSGVLSPKNIFLFTSYTYEGSTNCGRNDAKAGKMLNTKKGPQI